MRPYEARRADVRAHGGRRKRRELGTKARLLRLGVMRMLKRSLRKTKMVQMMLRKVR